MSSQLFFVFYRLISKFSEHLIWNENVRGKQILISFIFFTVEKLMLKMSNWTWTFIMYNPLWTPNSEVASTHVVGNNEIKIENTLSTFRSIQNVFCSLCQSLLNSQNRKWHKRKYKFITRQLKFIHIMDSIMFRLEWLSSLCKFRHRSIWDNFANGNSVPHSLLQMRCVGFYVYNCIQCR